MTLSAFCWNMGKIFEAYSYNLLLALYNRVDPMVGTDTVKETPMKLAADRDSKLYNMMVTWNWNLKSSLPVELVIFFHIC